MHQTVLLLPHVLIPENKRAFKLLCHVLHLPPHSLSLIHFFLHLVVQLLVSWTNFLKLQLQHLLLTHRLLPLPFIEKQFLLIARVLVHKTLVVLKQPIYLLGWNHRLHPCLRSLLVKLLHLLQLGPQSRVLLPQSRRKTLFSLVFNKTRTTKTAVRKVRPIWHNCRCVGLALQYLKVSDLEIGARAHLR